METLGWRLHDQLPDIDKYLVIGGPHTSNWDFVLGLMCMEAIGLKRVWIGKHQLFRWPHGWFFRWIGGIPVNRSSSHNFVDQVVEIYDRSEKLAFTMAPEATRSKTDHWKTGFYYIARGAGVPILLGYLDYSCKEGGAGPLIHPTGDIEADFETIREFYSTKRGLNPELASNVRLKPGP
ncbi:MAG: lysophospholipid acyltransferase family protein [Deltaproteobacteria bacterium]|nr:lysophospholipid acyltransferase family protein [Deltaproteobacteria bacterium]